MLEDGEHYRRYTVHYKATKTSKLFSIMFEAVKKVFESLGCEIIHTKDEPINESDIPTR